MLIDRHILGADLRFVDFDGRKYDRDQFIQLMERWKTYLQDKVKPNDIVAIYAENTIVMYALGFALWEMGVCFFGDDIKYRLIDRALNKVKAHTFFIDKTHDSAKQEIPSHIPVVMIPAIEEFLTWPVHPLPKEYVCQETDEILVGFTSGTSGESKIVYHTHSSLLAPSHYMAKNFYRASDRILLYLNLNHLGYISCILLACMQSGCEIHIIPFSDPELLYKIIQEREVNVVPLFSYNWFELNQRYPDLSLKNVDTTITGGDFVSQAFAKSILDKGAKRIVNIYGMTEALPPVSIKIIDQNNITNYSGQDLGEIVSYDEVVIEDYEILVRGPNQGRVVPASAKRNGFTCTGDEGILKGNNLIMTERKKYFLNVSDREVSSADVKSFVRTMFFEGKPLNQYVTLDAYELETIAARAVLIIACKEPEALQTLTIDYINDSLRPHFGADFKLDHLVILKELPFNGIKVDRKQLRRNIAAQLSLK